MTEDVLVKKMAENKLEKTEMVDKSEKEDESSTKTAEAKPDQTVKVELEPVAKKIVQERNIQKESAEEKRKKVNAILKFERELAKDRKRLKRKPKREKTSIPLWTKIMIVVLS